MLKLNFLKGIKMKIVKKALYSTLMLACVSMLNPAQAQTEEATSKPRAVIFKLHEIKPVMDTEGVITNCDFIATFYNRTDDSIRQAKIELGWTDNVSDKYVIDPEAEEQEEVVVSKPFMRSSRNNKQEEKLGDIITTVDMPSLGAYKQVSVKGTVKTEKCFLLLDNLEFKVSSCTIVGKDTETKTSSRRRSAATKEAAPECANLFEYIDSQNPEYYDEFKNISFSEQERLFADDRKQDISSLESTYEQVIKNFEKAEKIIGNIQ